MGLASISVEGQQNSDGDTPFTSTSASFEGIYLLKRSICSKFLGDNV